MKFSTKLLGAACGLALVAMASPAMAVNATVSGSYGHLSASGGGADVFGVNGALEGMFSDNWGAEGQVDYHNISSGVGDFWSASGSAFWKGDTTTLAATYDYHSVTGGLNLSSYGVGAKFNASPAFTLAAHGGGVSGSGASGGYIGGDVAWYVMPNLAIDGAVDYISISSLDTTTETIKAEWLFSESTPISVYAGYQHSDFFSVNTNTWFIGLKLYANEGGGSLAERQQNGTVGYAAESPLFIDQL